jgi:hypothetical protein
LFLICSRSNYEMNQRKQSLLRKYLILQVRISLHNIWHIFASNISWFYLLIRIVWLFAFCTAILLVILFIDPHFYSTYIVHWRSLRTKWAKNIWPKRKRKKQGDEENLIKRSSVSGTRYQVIVGRYIKDNNVNRKWSLHLEMKTCIF